MLQLSASRASSLPCRAEWTFWALNCTELPSESRVTSTASLSLACNRYAVDPSLIGRRVELRFDPEDLTRMDVFWEGRPVGQAIPFIVGRHVHHQVPQAQPPGPPPSTGVDYLGLVLAEHDEHLLGQIAYRDLPRALDQHA